MSSDFWAKRIGGIAQPRPQAPAQQGAWWQDSPPPQHITGMPLGNYGQPVYPNPSLQAQMPGQYPGQVSEQDIRELRSRLDAGLGGLSQEEMELIAEWELDNVPRHTARCPQCGSGNFAPAGTKNAHGKLGSDKCFECLSGDTEVVTREGIRKIKELAGTTASLLVPTLTPNGNRGNTGKFVEAPVRAFGEQELYQVTFTDGQSEKVVETTVGHRWYGSVEQGDQWEKTTLELREHDKLATFRRFPGPEPKIMRVAVAQGFTFGDGSSSYGDKHEHPASVHIYDNGKDDAMLKFFDGHVVAEGRKWVGGLPRFWKRLPPLDESRSFLLSWLAGYFAADGSVSKSGHCKISSATREHLDFVRDVCAVTGVRYGQVSSGWRIGINQTEPSELFTIGIKRRDLPSWFFVIKEHHRRVSQANAKSEVARYWRVKSVEPTGRMEIVYCATVAGVSAFSLADNLLTGNCGQSSSTYTSSPEPAARGGGASKAPWLDVRQTDTGGGAGSMYLQFPRTPASYVPRG